MAEFPAMPLFTDAYLGDTTHLTTLEHGAYLLLLMAQWRSRDGRLPDDDKLLARYVKATPGEWKKVREILSPFFLIRGGFWIQLRLQDEWKFVRDKREKNIRAGKVSALKRKGRHSTDVITDVSTEGQHEGNQPTTHNPQPIKKESLTTTPSVTRPASRDEDESANYFFRSIFDKGSEAFPNLATRRTAAISKWFESGAKIEDVYPEIENAKKRGVDVRSWDYFSPGIASAIKTRLSPMPEGKPREGAKKDFDVKHMEAAAAAVQRMENE